MSIHPASPRFVSAGRAARHKCARAWPGRCVRSLAGWTEIVLQRGRKKSYRLLQKEEIGGEAGRLGAIFPSV